MRRVEEGDIVAATVEDISSEGWGVCRVISESESLPRAVVFVPGTIPGETVKVRITAVRKGFFTGEVAGLIHPSADRVVPACRYVPGCQGCSLQHMSYPAQCRAKEERVRRLLVRAFHSEPGLKFVPSPVELGYRTHISLECMDELGILSIGFTSPNSRRIIDIDRCLLVPDWANEKLGALRSELRGRSAHLPRKFKFRVVLDYSEKKIFLVPPRGIRREPSWKVLRKVLREYQPQKLLKMDVCGVELSWHPESFVQANHYLIETLYSEALARIPVDPSLALCELYAGSGFFTLAMLGKARFLLAIEEDSKASGLLARSVLERQSPASGFHRTDCRVEVLGGKAENLLEHIRRLPNPAVVVANPPRSGMHPAVSETLAANRDIASIVMVSCDISTCIRDIQALSKGGFVPGEFTLLDLYPQTPHVEIVVALERH